MSFFAEFNFEILYKPGPKNANADYLSRPVRSVLVMKQENMEPSLMDILKYLSEGSVPGKDAKVARAIKARARNYLVYDQELYRRTSKGIRYIPGIQERSSIMTGLHDEIGHWDFKTTYDVISQRFWWPTIRPYVSRFVKSCDVCQKINPPAQNRPYGKMPISGLFHTWSIDFEGPLPVTYLGARYKILAVEHMTGWPVAQPID